MGNAVVGSQLHHFGVHHDKAHLVGAGLVHQADNERVGTNGFAGAGGAGNEHVGQPCDISHDAVSADILAHREGHGGLMIHKSA
ncbi:hypothetical protein SDC9_120342 [bioreactor metagenome]|uniref:Uncharacterized protein n=1 Tax=bioreactor metagenome TaxID=1076179 RepID=A0A645C6Q3_9ZZZZ